MMAITRNSGRIARAAIALTFAAALPGRALDLQLPASAIPTAQTTSVLGSYAMPVAPWTDGNLPIRTAEGRVSRRAWRIDGTALTTLQILAPLRAQLLAQGYEIVLDCHADQCGGFDFRFATDVMPAPGMFVDLARYRFVSARRGDPDRPEVVSVLVSRNGEAGFVQVIHVAPADGAGIDLAPAQAAAEPAPTGAGMAAALDNQGRAVLRDLAFETGSAALGPDDYPSLAALAEYLRQHPGRVVALVGHTDSVGGLDGNIALSRRRARSVADRLAERYGVPRAQITAEGVGYLAPLASNLTDQGRELNRRVEAVLISTE